MCVVEWFLPDYNNTLNSALNLYEGCQLGSPAGTDVETSQFRGNMNLKDEIVLISFVFFLED